jgi:hypothetical protein
MAIYNPRLHGGIIPDDTSFYDDEVSAEELNAQAVSTANRLMNRQIQTDMIEPQIIVQTLDPITGEGVTQGIISVKKDLHNLLQNMPVSELASAGDLLNSPLNSGSFQQQIPSPVPQAAQPLVPQQVQAISYQTAPVPRPPVVQTDTGESALKTLGLDFLSSVPQPPSVSVTLNFSGPVRFKFPIPCHKVVVTDQLIALVSDKRVRAAESDIDIGADASLIRSDILLPDGTSFHVIAPIPRVISFDIGVLRCVIFIRLPEDEPARLPEPDRAVNTDSI